MPHRAMMAKLTILVASLVLFLAVANASIYRATVEFDDENPRGRQQGCQEQIMRQQQLRSCQMFMRERSHRYIVVWGSESDDNQQQQYFRECCGQLEQLDSRCRCQGLEQAMRKQQQQMGPRGREMQQLYETASELPRMCNVQPMQGCDFRSPY